MKRHALPGTLALLGMVACAGNGSDAAQGDGGAGTASNGGSGGGSASSGSGGSSQGGNGADGGASGQGGSAGTGDGPPEPLVFSVMGDVPYSLQDIVLLPEQISQHNAQSSARFMVHLGDIKGGSAGCFDAVYSNVSSILLELVAPCFVIVGDNDWNDCDSGGVGPSPAEAWDLWNSYFLRFETNWPTAPRAAHQTERPENFAWVEEQVLLVGITLPGGRVHDAEEWSDFLKDDVDWVEAQLALHADDVYAMVLFAHASPTSNHDPFMIPFRAAAAAFGKPVLFMHGDGHVWVDDRPWPEAYIRRIQVDQGGSADPLEVTVTPMQSDPFTLDRDALQ